VKAGELRLAGILGTSDKTVRIPASVAPRLGAACFR